MATAPKLALLKPRSTVWSFVQVKVAGFKRARNFAFVFAPRFLYYLAAVRLLVQTRYL